ncbi:alpha-amylase family glycosyl hydrolase [uncultured Lutibacter sp.]|uniref:alpha-amylase family glycosyl hydrolase n=1 Tax=uncultured Lutibacter sp. TaxID=437739 RepID=UPI00261C5D98|nr:alpha-amylase family glycosyl hydrolase [uncultured Lutibacter sp.]
MQKYILYFILLISFIRCKNSTQQVVKAVETPFIWENVTMYFLLTDRFFNGDTNNDVNFNRTQKAGKLRGFEGGDIKGIIKKIEAGYFTNLGVNAIWLSPVYEQIHGATDEGTGLTYAYHGYWTKDWTSLEPNFGTKEDLKKLVEIAHAHGIRIVLDAVINHTGPVTEVDTVWPKNWVRTSPQCTYQGYESTVKCTLVENLPDIKTESNTDVNLPPHLIEKWKKEGRYEQEMAELEAFFKQTGYPRAPKYYIMKWLADYITDYGIDGYRADTVKHTEEDVWQDFKKVCDNAFENYKINNPDKILDNNNFYLVAEVYNYGISGGRYFDFGDKKVDYFNKAFQSSINFEFKWNAAQDTYEEIFSRYSSILNNELKGYGVLNYISSHDDGSPYDAKREQPLESATKLLLSPGGAQIYYGDETARSLIIEETVGDATLRSNMNWNDISTNKKTKEILAHWQKLGKFRSKHPSIGAGIHKMISEQPYVFKRTYSENNFNDSVVVGIDLQVGKKELFVEDTFANGTKLIDFYSNTEVEVKNNKVTLITPYTMVLLEKKI